MTYLHVFVTTPSIKDETNKQFDSTLRDINLAEYIIYCQFILNVSGYTSMIYTTTLTTTSLASSSHKPFDECTFDVCHVLVCGAFIIIIIIVIVITTKITTLILKIIVHCLFTIKLIKYTFYLPREVKQTAKPLFCLNHAAA